MKRLGGLVAVLVILIRIFIPLDLSAELSDQSDTQWEKIYPKNIFVIKYYRKSPTLKFQFQGGIGDADTVHKKII